MFRFLNFDLGFYLLDKNTLRELELIPASVKRCILYLSTHALLRWHGLRRVKIKLTMSESVVLANTAYIFCPTAGTATDKQLPLDELCLQHGVAMPAH